jgi:hypothetical protein
VVGALSGLRRARDRAVGRAWVVLVAALALHVADEAAHDFLSVYNPTVTALRERAPWLPLPTFEFRVWLFGLVAAVVVLLALSPWLYRGARALRPGAYLFGVLMALNALGHLGGSLVVGQRLPGVYSSPVLLLAALLLLRALARSRSTSVPSPP